MTRKIQNIAMFAIAAFALVGIAGAPAFASQTITYNLLNPGVNGTPDVDTEYNVCSSGHNIITTVTPYTTYGGYVKVVTDATSCSGFEEVSIMVERNDNWCGAYTHDDDLKTVNFWGCDFEAGDKIEVWATYTK